MKSWPIKPLGNLLKIQNGFAFESERFNNVKQGLPIIRIRDLARSYSETFYDGEHDSAYEVSDGDFLIGMDGEFRCYRWHGGKALLNQRVCRLRGFDSSLNSSYVFYGINQHLSEIEANTAFVTVKHLSSKQIAKIEMPVPPLAEQERIVKLLDEADELRKLRAQADRRTDALIPALFHKMFGDPTANPKRWKLTAISEMAEVQGGLQVTSQRDSYALRRPYLRVANVQRGFLVLDEIKEIGLLDAEHERVKLARGDLLLVEGNGNPKEVGRAAIWNGSIEDCVHQNHLIRVRPRGDLLTSNYLLAFVNSESGRSYFHGSGNTTSGLVTISTSIVKKCRIPVPPLALQNEFAARVTEICAEQAEQAASRQRLDDLFQSMLHRAFNGEL